MWSARGGQQTEPGVDELPRGCSVNEPVRAEPVNNCDTLTTDGFGNPPARGGNSTLPGASASRMFEVMAATITVEIRDRLKRSDDTTSAGRRKPGIEPTRNQSR